MGAPVQYRLGELTGFLLKNVKFHGPLRIVVYCDRQAHPVFVSKEHTMKNDLLEFEDIDFSPLTPMCARSTKIIFRVFGKNQDWSLVAEQTMDLTELLRADDKLADPSSVLAVQVDTDFYVNGKVKAKRNSHGHSAAITALRQSLGERLTAPLSTLGYDMLTNLLVLQRCSDDALISIHKSSVEINESYRKTAQYLGSKQKELGAKLAKTKSYITVVKLDTEALNAQTRKLVSSSKQSHDSLAQSTHEFEQVPAHSGNGDELKSSRAIGQEQHRLAEGLQVIFPIEPTEASFHFTICGLPLPSVFAINHFDPAEVGAALGLVAQLVLVISSYLDVALPYPIRPFGSQSYIIDPLSNIKGTRIFPLWTKGALLYRVEYGLYLLHRDIEQLMVAKQLAVVDLKQTLANLKNLLLVMSS